MAARAGSRLAMRGSIAIAGLAALAALMASAHADDYPDRPLTLVVAFADGGPQDAIAHALGGGMGDILKQKVNVENAEGTDGIHGIQRVADAAPDGYTMLFGSAAIHEQYQAIFRRPFSNTLTDLTPVALLTDMPLVLVARKDLPVEGLKDFIAYAKANEAKMTYGSAGAGTATNLGCATLNAAMETQLIHVPYRSIDAATRDLQAGRIDFVCSPVAAAKPFVVDGRLKAIAVLSKERSALLPSLATAREQGLKVEASVWDALFLPKGASPDTVAKLNRAAIEALAAPAVQARLTDVGAVAVSAERQTPEYLGTFVRSEVEKWIAALKASGISAH